MLKRMAEYMVEHRMVAPGDLVIVAVSGGPDSVALLHLLHRLSNELAFRLHVFHLDHGLRGADSAADALYVQDLSEQLGIPATVVSLRAGELKSLPGSLQANARSVRYAELAALANRLGAQRVALGHNRDDQAETVLIRFLRGSGPKGLSGIPPTRTIGSVTLIRPLLAVPRVEIERYCEQNRLHPRQDASNLRTDYLRNRIRLELLPQLTGGYNPALSENLAQMATLLWDEDRYLDELAGAALDRCRTPGEGVRLAGSVLLREPLALARRVVRLAARETMGPEYDLGLKGVSGVLELAAAAQGSHRADLPGGLQVWTEYGTLRFERGLESPPHIRAEWPLWTGGTRVLTEVGLRVTASLSAGPLEKAPSGRWVAAFDPGKLPGPLSIRYRRPGDRLWPVGLQGSKKLQDLLVDAKVPLAERDRIPLLVAGEEVLWVIGYRLDRRFLAQPDSPNALLIQVDPQPCGEG